MTFRVRHSRILTGPEDPNGRLGPIDHNADYIHSMNPGFLLGRITPTVGPVEEISLGDGLALDPALQLNVGTPDLTVWDASWGLGPPLAGAGTMALVANTLYAVPIFFNKQGVLNQLVCSVTGLVAATNIRLGLANNRPGGVGPGTILYDGASAQSSATTGIKGVVGLNISITRLGLYWLLLVSDGAPTVASITLKAGLLGYNGSLQSINRIVRAFTYNTFSDESAQTYTRETGTNNLPFICATG